MAPMWFAALLLAAPAGVDWFAVDELATVFEDGYNLPARRAAVETFGIRGEVLSAQAVILAREAPASAAVEIVPPRHESGTGELSVAWNFVGSVPVPVNTPGTDARHLTRAAPARFPDYLSGERAASIPAGQARSVWFTIRIPRDAAPGLYAGSARVSGASLPLKVTVYPQQMPEERHLMVTHWYNTARFAKFHATGEPYSERFYEILKAYAANMAEHRQNVFRVDLGSINAARNEAGQLAFDFSRFDRWAEVFWSTGKMDRLETGFVARFGPQGHSDTAIVLRDFPATQAGRRITVAGREYLSALLPAFERHLKEKGWLEKTLFHVCDEPSSWNLASWREASAFIHKHAPGLKRIDAIETTGFDGALEVWVPKLNHFHTWFDAYKQAQRGGAELWFYTCMHPRGVYINRFLDFALIKTRLLHWLNYRFGATGYLHWGLNSWTENPFEVMNDARLGPGDAWAVYPKRDGLMDSIRWETLRNSLQDYEYFWLLEDRMRAVKRRGGEALAWLDPARRGVELASRAVRAMDDYTLDAAVLYGARRQVLEEIADLERTPAVVVQTDPPEGARVLNGPAGVAVRGWTSPGAQVTINGRAVAVAPEGTFFHTAGLDAKRSRVTVQVNTPAGEKTVVRQFRIVE